MQIKQEDTICHPPVPSGLMDYELLCLFFLESNLAVTHKGVFNCFVFNVKFTKKLPE